MDSRFPPQPDKILVPLYPTRHLWTSSIHCMSSDFGKLAASHYDVDRSQIVLANRGSEALMLFLLWLSKQQSEPLLVAVPAFCCKEVLQAIICAGANPFFIDITEQGTIAPASIESAQKAGCRVIIMPQFFGDRAHHYQKQGMIFIDDEAQSFPSRYRSDADISLFSCGMSKRLAGVGGGGLCFHNKTLAKEFESEKFVRFCTSHSFFSQISSLIKRQLIEINRSLAVRLGLIRHLESDLKVLLESWSTLRPQMHYLPMSSHQQTIAAAMMRKFAKCGNQHSDRTLLLKEIVCKSFGISSLSLLKNLGMPSIFAIQVASRFKVSQILALRGIQTTWYYYPLNRLTIFSHHRSLQTPVTEKVASEILILPFQWKHTSKQFRTLCEALSCENFSAF